MRFEALSLPGPMLVRPDRHGDARGSFARVFCEAEFAAAGLPTRFPQANTSFNAAAGTLRGLHYQAPPHAQGKLVRCGRGRLFDVAVDGRVDSPNWGRAVGVELSAENGRQLWVPAGFLHGFVTREDDTEIVYKCTDYYDRDSDGAVRWDSVDVDWGVSDPVLSDKDRAATPFQDWKSPFKVEA